VISDKKLQAPAPSLPRRLAAAASVAAAIALALALTGAAALAGTFGGFATFLVGTTGDQSELVRTVRITKQPGVSQRVAMSMTPNRLPDLQSGDQVRVTAEFEVTTDCLRKSTHCVGTPYKYNPNVRTQLILAPDGSTTEGLAISRPRVQKCRQKLPSREHHCMVVFTNSVFDVDPQTLPCPLDGCFVNLVVSADNRNARQGEKLLIGADEPDGSIMQDKGRINALRLRPGSKPPDSGQVKTFVKDELTARRLPVGDGAQENKTVVLSRRLQNLARRDQLVVNGKVELTVSHLDYNASISTRVILGRQNSTHVSSEVKRRATLRGEVTEGNGFNCTQATSPCVIRKVGVTRIIEDVVDDTGEPFPIYVNVVVGNDAIGGKPRTGDEIRITGGRIEVVRIPSSRYG
jgi:hypothetical protein